MALSTMTFLALVNEIADTLGLRTNGTLTGSSTTALTCATYPYKNNRTNADNSLYVGAEVYVTSGATPTPNPNGISAYAPATGVFTPSVDYSVAPDNGSTFSLYLRDVSMTEIRAAVNDALRKRYYKTYWPVTLVDDGDMRSSATSAYTASNATLSKVTTSGNVVYGPRSLRTLSTSGAGYGYQRLKVPNPSSQAQWYIQALVRAEVGTARLTVYDVTNAATILSEDWDKLGWGIVNFSFQIPSGCEQIEIRLGTSATSDDAYWNYVMAYPQGMESVALPDWVDRAGQVQQVYRLPITDPLAPDHALTRPVMWWKLRENLDNANSAYTLQFYPGTGGAAWVEVYKPYATLSADTDTTTINRDWIELAGSVELLGRLIRRPPTTNTDNWKQQYILRIPRLRRTDDMYMPPGLRIQMPNPY